MDFAGWIETWRRVLTQPGEPVFEQEKANPNGTLQTALIWMVIAGLVAAIFGGIAGLMGISSTQAALEQMGLPADAEAGMAPLMGVVTAISGFGAIIAVPLFFLIGTFILHLVARMLGGQGEYSTFAYLASTYQAPITMISSVLAIIPVVGGCVGALLGIYTYVLSYYAVKTNYNLTSGRALAVVLIPLALLILLVICFGAIVAGSIIAISGSGN